MCYNESQERRLLECVLDRDCFMGNISLPGKELRIYLQSVMIVDLRVMDTASSI